MITYSFCDLCGMFFFIVSLPWHSIVTKQFGKCNFNLYFITEAMAVLFYLRFYSGLKTEK